MKHFYCINVHIVLDRDERDTGEKATDCLNHEDVLGLGGDFARMVGAFDVPITERQI